MKVTLLAVALSLTASVLPVSAQAVMRYYKLDIPRQSLDTALKDFAQQTGLQVARFSDRVDGSAVVGPISGKLSLEDALKALLEPRGLSYRMVSERTVVVLQPGSEPLAVTHSSGSADEATRKEVDERKGSDRTDRGQSAGGSSPEAPQASATQTAAEKSGLEKIAEVLVTATRRSQRAADVPISMNVLSADDLDQRQLVNSADYLRGMPGVNQTEGGYGGQSIIIRGLATTTSTVNFSGGSTVGTYFGETPTTNSEGLVGSSVDIKLVDVQRVEVLRGPQGTAFGSSSMGGTVRVIPAAPVLDSFEGRLEGGYSETAKHGGDNYDFQGVVNIPIVAGRMALRGVAYKYSDSGYYINKAGTDPAFQPFVNQNGVQAFAIDQKDVGATTSYGARAGVLFQATDNLRLSLNYLNQSTLMDGYPLANAGTYSQDLLQIPQNYVRRGVTAGAHDMHVEIINPMLEYDLGWASLLTTLSYLHGASDHGFPAGALFQADVFGPVAFSQNGSHIERTGEVRFVTKLSGAWNFVAGLYYDKQHDTYDSGWQWYGDPALNPFVPQVADLFLYTDRRGLQEKTEYGEVSWEFLPRLTLTGGVRHYHDDRDTHIVQSGPAIGDVTAISDIGNQASGNTYRANLSYKPDNGTLLYAGYSQGFRLGSPQGGIPAALCDKDGDGIIDGTDVSIASTTKIASDTVDSYEVGGKFAFLGRRISIDTALFRMDWKNIPSQVSPPCGYAYTANLGAARVLGIELQANFQLTQALLLAAGGSYTDAVLTSDVPAQALTSGTALPGSPKTIANLSLQYGFKVGSHPALVRADSSYVGPYYLGIPVTPTGKAGSYVKLDATARVTLEGGLNVDLFVHNLTDEAAFVTRGTAGGVQLQPRTVGIQFGFPF